MDDPLDAEAAKSVVMRLLQERESRGAVACVLYGEPRDYGRWWVQGYQGRAFMVEGDSGAALAGNGPFVVPKDGSEPFTLSSALPADEQMERLRRSDASDPR